MPGGGQTAEEENPCDPVNCLQLEKEIEEDHDFLKNLKESLKKLNSSGKGESATATYLKENIASSQGGLRGKLLTWKDCCQNKTGPSKAIRIFMDWQLKRDSRHSKKETSKPVLIYSSKGSSFRPTVSSFTTGLQNV